jgi:hypothetical protein
MLRNYATGMRVAGMASMGKRRRSMVSHAEGEHGPRTQSRIVEQLRSGPSGMPLEDRLAIDQTIAADIGKRRLVERRDQHDHGEKNSEITERRDRDFG